MRVTRIIGHYRAQLCASRAIERELHDKEVIVRAGTAKRVAVIAVGALAMTALSACSTGSSGAHRNLSCTNTVVNKDAPKVSVWAWYPSFGDVVDTFNQAHDDVQVCWNQVGNGDDQYAKLNTAIAAGSGGPDVAQIETGVVPSYIAQKALLNLDDFGAAEVKKNYSEGAWADVSTANGTFAIPVDGGPMGYLYRADIFEKYNVPIPKTWAEFAQAAQQLRDAGYKGYIANFPTNGRGLQLALYSQAGAEPFSVDAQDPTKLGIHLNSPEIVQVLKYWQDLISRKLVSSNDRTTTDDNARMLNGTYASYIAPAWGPGYLAGLAKDGKKEGKWVATTLPQWDANDPVQVNWGGSSFVAMKGAADPKLAARVAMEIFGSEETWKVGIEKAALFPLYKPILDSDYFRDLEYPFFDGQKINDDVFINAAAGYKGFANPPFLAFVYDKQTEALSAMANGKKSPQETADALQKTVVDYAVSQGYTVNG